MLGTESEFLVTPGLGFFVWLWIGVCVLAGAVVTALKGRWGWLAVGFLFGGTLWIVTAFLSASPDSVWARRAARRQSGAA